MPSEDDYCPHCRCDEQVSEPNHGINCPRYRGPGPSSDDELRERVDTLESEVAELKQRLDKIERKAQ